MKLKIGTEVFIKPEELPGAYTHLQDCPWQIIQKSSGYYGEKRWVVELGYMDKEFKINYIQLSIVEEAIDGVVL